MREIWNLDYTIHVYTRVLHLLAPATLATWQHGSTYIHGNIHFVASCIPWHLGLRDCIDNGSRTKKKKVVPPSRKYRKKAKASKQTNKQTNKQTTKRPKKGVGVELTHTLTMQAAAGNAERLAKPLLHMLRRRGFVWPGSSIYGGFANTYDYGPLGTQMKDNIVASWKNDFVTRRIDCSLIDSAIIQHPQVWEASG